MNAIGQGPKNDPGGLLKFVKGLNKEQADLLIAHLPTVIAILEAQGERFLRIPFQRTG